jgi:hypothetical protein
LAQINRVLRVMQEVSSIFFCKASNTTADLHSYCCFLDIATSNRHVSKHFEKNSRYLSANLAARLRIAIRDSTCVAVFVTQSFHVDFAVQAKVSVGVTWDNLAVYIQATF